MEELSKTWLTLCHSLDLLLLLSVLKTYFDVMRAICKMYHSHLPPCRNKWYVLSSKLNEPQLTKLIPPLFVINTHLELVAIIIQHNSG